MRILAYLHISFAGIYAFSKTVMVGESEEMRLMAPIEAVEVADKNRDVIVGIKVRVGRGSSAASMARRRSSIALQAANELGMPLMCHIDFPPPSYEEVVQMLRPGDVLTHAFRPFPNAPYDHQGKVKDVVREARARGVKFDIGHGKGSFAFKTARSDAGERLLSRHDLVRRAHAVHRRPGVRPGDDAVEIPLHGHAAQRRDRGVAP